MKTITINGKEYSGILKTKICDLIDEYCKTNPDNLPAFPLLGILDFISEVFVDSGFVLANSPKEKKKGKNK